MYQKTLMRSISCSGVGVHSGAPVSMTLRPAPEHHGITFQRTDITDISLKESIIPALWSLVDHGDFCTKLTNEFGYSISTVEHLMAAFAGLGISNAIIEVDGPELPIMDGSAAPFLFLVECAGIKEQSAPLKYIRILKEISVEGPHGFATLAPSNTFKAEAEMTFSHKAHMDSQKMSCHNVIECFKKDFARARTFGFYCDVEKLKAAGLARGGSLENAVVFENGKALNPEGLRFEDECIRHKLLDMVGDLYLAGGHILGHFKGKNFGHALNNQLLRTLFEDRTAWEVGFIETNPTPLRTSFNQNDLPRPAIA